MTKRKTAIERFNNSYEINNETGCWEWTAGTFTDNYGGFRNKNVSGQSAHRWSYWYHNNIDPAELCVLHKCDNPSCVNPNHLFLGTRQDNNFDRDKKNRQLKGEKHPNHKLTEKEAIYIKYTLLLTKTVVEISELYNVSSTTIYNIKSGRRWKHI